MLGYKNLRKYPRKRLEEHNTIRIAELSVGSDVWSNIHFLLYLIYFFPKVFYNCMHISCYKS